MFKKKRLIDFLIILKDLKDLSRKTTRSKNKDY